MTSDRVLAVLISLAILAVASACHVVSVSGLFVCLVVFVSLSTDLSGSKLCLFKLDIVDSFLSIMRQFYI